jgi:hypothetical protein
VVIAGSCDDGTTIVSAHNTQDKSLGYLIRIDGRLVEQGRLEPGERVQRTYEVPLGESHFYRIRLGLPVDHVYFSDEAATDRTNCPSPTSSSTTPPPFVHDTTAHVIVELQRKLLDVVEPRRSEGVAEAPRGVQR